MSGYRMCAFYYKRSQVLLDEEQILAKLHFRRIATLFPNPCIVGVRGKKNIVKTIPYEMFAVVSEVHVLVTAGVSGTELVVLSLRSLPQPVIDSVSAIPPFPNSSCFAQ